MLNAELLIKNLQMELVGADINENWARGIQHAIATVKAMESEFSESADPGLLQAAIREVTMYGAVCTTRSSTGGRCVSLAFTKLQEADHWMMQDLSERKAKNVGV